MEHSGGEGGEGGPDARIVPPSLTYSGFCPHSRSTARSASRNSLLSGSASHQSPTERTRTAMLLAERSFLNSCSTWALWIARASFRPQNVARASMTSWKGLV